MLRLYQTDTDLLSSGPLTKHCLVLDLDETLVHTSKNYDNLETLNIFWDCRHLSLRPRTYRFSLLDITEPHGTGSFYNIWGTTRPGLKEFLIFCFSYFQVVAIWSAGKDRYVHSIVEFIFRDLPRPRMIYNYNHCEKYEDGTVTKPLNQMIRNEPGLSNYMKMSNTFIVDDCLDYFNLTNPENGILMIPYEPEDDIKSICAPDDTFNRLKAWFMKPDVMSATDIRKLNKKYVFSTPIPRPLPPLSPRSPRRRKLPPLHWLEMRR